ncbi:MAG: peptidylprolyl isomerase [Gammaproteobacteria bacterium]|nr:peptidylprolyl isomerase [Gammaproteobacteria bacterium]
MNTKLLSAVFLLTLTPITLLTMHPATAGDDPMEKAVATVNGTEITEWTLQRYAKQRGQDHGLPSAQQRRALIDELINRELVYQNAQQIGVDKTPNILAEINHQRINIIASVMLSRSSSLFAVSDADLKKEYDNRKGELGGPELKARHILLENEQDAKDVITELDKGAKFETLAGERSTGPSAANGGDLGWFNPSEMVEEFSLTAAALPKGSYSKTPVKTQFGWHVILLEDTRIVEPPPFDSIKEQIRVGLQNILMEEYIAGLRDGAEIERN